MKRWRSAIQSAFTLIELLGLPGIARRQAWRRQVRSAFTLIELLVVIAIISILAALLLPALKKARDRGKMVVCSGKLNQMGKAQYCYGNDHDGFPTIVYGNNSTWEDAGSPPKICARWQELLCSYLGWNWDSETETWPPSGDPVFFCPSARPEWRVGFGNNIRNLLAYGINRENVCYEYGPLRFSAIEKPGNMFFKSDLYDRAAAESMDYPVVVVSTSWNNAHLSATRTFFSWRHNGRANVLFYDGHVESKKPGPNIHDAGSDPIPENVDFD